MSYGKPEIYIIDDDPGVLFLHRIIVEESGLGHDARTFSDAGKALESIIPLDTSGTRILIFLDINMPKMDGWEFLVLLNKNISYADVRVVMVTSSLSRTEQERSREFEAVIDFWEKPMDDIQVSGLKEKLGDWLSASGSGEV